MRRWSVFISKLSNMKTWVKIIPLKLLFLFFFHVALKWRRLKSHFKVPAKVIYIHPFPPTFRSYNTQEVTKVRNNINSQHHLKPSFPILSPGKSCHIILIFYISCVVPPSQKIFWRDFTFVLFFYNNNWQRGSFGHAHFTWKKVDVCQWKMLGRTLNKCFQ